MSRENPEEINIGGNKEVEQGGLGESGGKTQSKGAHINIDEVGKCMKQANESNQKKPSQKELRKIKEERKELWRIKKANRDKNKKKMERKKQEQKEAMIKKRKEKTMSQHTLIIWAKGEGGLEKEHKGEMARNTLRRDGTMGVKKGIGKGKGEKNNRR